MTHKVQPPRNALLASRSRDPVAPAAGAGERAGACAGDGGVAVVDAGTGAFAVAVTAVIDTFPQAVAPTVAVGDVTKILLLLLVLPLLMLSLPCLPFLLLSESLSL